MKVLLLANGDAQKLYPLTEVMPSALVPVVGRPIMEHILEMLARQSIKQMFVSLQFRAGSIEAYFGSGRRWGAQLDYFLQRDTLGSAGAMKWAQTSLDETFLVIPADIMLDLDIQSALEQHRSQGNAATMIVNQTAYPAARRLKFDEQGCPLIDPDSSQSGRRQPSMDGYITGAYLFEPQVLKEIPARTHFDIQTQLIPALVSKGLQVGVHCMEGYWNPLDTFKAYQEAQSTLMYHLMSSSISLGSQPVLRFYSLEGKRIMPGVWAGKNSFIHPTARILPPVFIGAKSQIGRDVELGPDVVIGENVIVDEGASIASSTILNQTYVGQMVNIERRVVRQNMMIDLDSSESVKIADAFLLSALKPNLSRSGWVLARDRLLALLLLVLSLPLTLPLALALWFTTGRIFTSQLRACRKSGAVDPAQSDQVDSFRLIRFADSLKNGSSTAFTRWMKHWGLVRIPELLNVLTGDLRLVGVYPLTMEDARQTTEAWQEKMRNFYPGLTGLWYVQSQRGSEVLELQVIDAYYIATRSWKKDLAILIQTPAAWLRRRKIAQTVSDSLATSQVVQER